MNEIDNTGCSWKQDRMIGMKKYRSYGICAALAIAFVVCFLQTLGMTGFTSWHTIRDLLISFVVLVLGQALVREHLGHRIWYGSYVLFFLWLLVFPVVLVLSAKGWTVNFGDIASYYKSALFTGIGMAFLFALGKRYSYVKWMAVIGYVVVACVFSLIALVYVGYYTIFHIAFAAGDMLPIVQTSWREAEGFLLLHAHMGTLLAVILGFFLYLVGCGALVWYSMSGRVGTSAWPRWKMPLLLVLVGILAVQVSGNLKDGFPFYEYRAAKEYIDSVKVAEQVHAEHAKTFQLVGGAVPLPKKLPGTVLVVIGESETSEHMKAFNEQYPIETTPWLSSEQEGNGFYLLQNGYSNFPQTMQALGMYLTGSNQYNGKKLTDTLSLMDVAKAAGYETWWVSNQDKMADRNSPEVMVAGWADHEMWTSPSMMDDIKLLDFLKEIPAEGNHFIILHIMGSHSRYLERVPKDFTQIQVEGHDRNTNEYDTTVLYTDQVLQKIFEYARDHMNLQAMVYASDHGEDMKLGHGAGAFSFSMVRIPMFIYLSPEYRALYPETAKQLDLHRKSIFTNDLMYDTVSGLMQAPNSEYEARWDISSGQYALPLEQAVSKHGEVRLADDVEWIERTGNMK